MTVQELIDALTVIRDAKPENANTDISVWDTEWDNYNNINYIAYNDTLDCFLIY